MPIKADLGGKFQLTDLISPDTDADAATKGYVDEHESGATRYVAINSTGDSADAPGTDAIAIGERTTAAGDDSITIGTQNNGVGGVDPAAHRSISFGHGVLVAGNSTDSVGIGTDASVPSGHHSSVALGHGATTDQSNQFVLGDENLSNIKTPGFAPDSNSDNRHVLIDSDGNWELGAGGGGGINSVVTDSTVFGDGTAGFPLGIDTDIFNDVSASGATLTFTSIDGATKTAVISGAAASLNSGNAGDGIDITSNVISIELDTDAGDPGLDLTSSGLSVDTTIIATRDYVDSDFVLHGAYASIEANDSDFISVDAVPTQDNQVRIGDNAHLTNPNARLLSFRDDDVNRVDIVGHIFRIINTTASPSITGYYRINSISEQPEEGTINVYVRRQPIVGTDVLDDSQYTVGDTFDIGHDTDASTSAIHFGYGLNHDETGAVIVDTETIVDVDAIHIFANPVDSELVISATDPDISDPVAHELTVTIPSAPNDIQTFIFQDVDGTNQSIDVDFLGSGNQFTAAARLDSEINDNASFVSSTIAANSNVLTITWDNAGPIDGTPLTADEGLFVQAVVNEGADSEFTYPAGYSSIEIGIGLSIPDEDGKLLTLDTDYVHDLVQV